MTGGPYYRTSDPTAAIDLNGNVYLNTIVSIATDFNSGTRNLMISKSTDGGVTFGTPTIAYQQAKKTSGSPDKNWLTVNTFPSTPKPNRLLLTFTNNTSTAGPIYRTYSDDGGATWSSSLKVSSAGFCDGSRPLYLPNGKTVVLYSKPASNPNVVRLEIAVSSDGGTTFSTPTLITTPPLYEVYNVRTQKGNPGVATDRTAGNLYVTYQALTPDSSVPKIFFIKSTDTGVHWTSPRIISDNPDGSPVFTPAIAVSPDGSIVTVVFYDQRNDVGTGQFVDLYMTQSLDGGVTWQPNVRVSSVSTDLTLTPFTEGGYMLGDYIAVAEALNVNTPAIPT